MCGYRQICWMLVLMCLSPAILERNLVLGGQHKRGSGNHDIPVPRWKITYIVRYQTDSDGDSDACGKHYAQSFLQTFIHLDRTFTQECQAEVTTGHTTIKVTIDMVAMVRIFPREGRSEVTLNIYLYIEADSNNINQRNRAVGLCKNMLSDKFTNDGWVASQNLSAIPAIEHCSAATMRPPRLEVEEQMWSCQKNYYCQDADCRKCVPDMPSPDSTITTTPGATSEDPQVHCPACIEEVKNLLPEMGYANICGRAINCAAYLVLNSDRDHVDICLQRLMDVLNVMGASRCTIMPTSLPPGDYTNMTTPPPTLPHFTSPSSSLMSDSTSSSSVEEPSSTPSMMPDMPLWGIQVKDDITELHVTEGNEVVNMTFRAWANTSALCHSSPRHCSIHIRILFSHFASPSCRRTGRGIPQVVVGEHPWAESNNTCTIALTERTMNTDLHIPLRAKLDMKYDGTQTRNITIALLLFDSSSVYMQHAQHIAIHVHNADRKATCKSINDPHLATFDGLEYNNYYHGEFVFYKHSSLPFEVHTVYQQCSRNVSESCNCAVAVRSGDDVIVIDRCFKLKKYSQSLFTSMDIRVYVNGEFTPGTKIYQESDGHKYTVHLPTGSYIKVMANNDLLNVWMVASPVDLHNTVGLCGTFDGNPLDDLTYRSGYTELVNTTSGQRFQPRPFVLDWRVDHTGPLSLLHGVVAMSSQYVPERYCECEQDATKCGYAEDVETCDIYQGKDVTSRLLKEAQKVSRRRKRDVNNNVITAVEEEPIDINPNYTPPVHKWKKNWTIDDAMTKCENSILNSPTGKLCADLPGVDAQQEVRTCIEDIQITGDAEWINSAKAAMKEQCLEALQRNDSIPNDLANHISNTLCVNDCFNRGICNHGNCNCDPKFTGSDCSLSITDKPALGEVPSYGLCDVRFMNCSTVIVYGQHFIDSPNLTCHMTPLQQYNNSYIELPGITKAKGIFVNFNAVECPVPSQTTYNIRVSNDGHNPSNPLLFIPFDSVCQECSAATQTCSKKRNSCIIGNQCYKNGEDNQEDPCLRCDPSNAELHWTSLDDPKCQLTVYLPDWLVAVIAAVAGSLVGVICGFLLYWCCCKSTICSSKEIEEDFAPQSGTQASMDPTDAILHRDHALSDFSTDLSRIQIRGMQEFPTGEYQEEETFFHNSDGKGVENGVNDNTYF